MLVMRQSDLLAGIYLTGPVMKKTAVQRDSLGYPSLACTLRMERRQLLAVQNLDSRSMPLSPP